MVSKRMTKGKAGGQYPGASFGKREPLAELISLALKLEPKIKGDRYSHANSIIARTLAKAGRFDEAFARVENAGCWFLQGLKTDLECELGLSLAREGRMVEAAGAFRTAVSGLPEPISDCMDTHGFAVGLHIRIAAAQGLAGLQDDSRESFAAVLAKIPELKKRCDAEFERQSKQFGHPVTGSFWEAALPARLYRKTAIAQAKAGFGTDAARSFDKAVRASMDRMDYSFREDAEQRILRGMIKAGMFRMAADTASEFYRRLGRIDECRYGYGKELTFSQVIREIAGKQAEAGLFEEAEETARWSQSDSEIQAKLVVERMRRGCIRVGVAVAELAGIEQKLVGERKGHSYRTDDLMMKMYSEAAPALVEAGARDEALRAIEKVIQYSGAFGLHKIISLQAGCGFFEDALAKLPRICEGAREELLAIIARAQARAELEGEAAKNFQKARSMAREIRYAGERVEALLRIASLQAESGFAAQSVNTFRDAYYASQVCGSPSDCGEQQAELRRRAQLSVLSAIGEAVSKIVAGAAR